MAPLTLEQRVVLFYRRWPKLKMSNSSIGKLNRANKIKRQALQFRKVRKETSEETFALQMAVLRSEIKYANAERKIIILIELCMFTKATMIK